MRTLITKEMDSVNGGGMHTNVMKAPGEGYDSSHTQIAESVGDSMMEGISDGLYDSHVVSELGIIKDIADLSAEDLNATYNIMERDCSMWETLGAGSTVISPQGAFFDVRVINWSAYDGGGTLTCQEATQNMVQSLDSGHPLSTYDYKSN